MKIVLIGYMGSGKTTVGTLLAKKLKIDFLDLDNYIEDKLKAKIPDIFRDKGEIFFRQKEHEYLKEILESECSLVIATGGGTPCYSNNMDTIVKQTELTFYLKVSIVELTQRLYKEKDHRPLIRHLDENELPEFIGKHLFERSPFYSMASHTILCDARDSHSIAEEIKMSSLLI